jgi:regulator of cell morphogenesis and NO signaling
MKTTAVKTVREFALENPAATRIFEQLGIDYCCGGEKPLDEACAAANLDLDQVLAKLDQPNQQTNTISDWQEKPLGELISHITATHHAFVRSEAPRILALLDKVCSKHGSNHAELHQAREVFEALAEELGSHLMKEESILFPYIAGLESSVATGGDVPHSCFGTVQNPIRMMMFEHDNAGGALRQLRQLTGDYAVPADACVSYRTLYEAMKGLEADLHQHIHLENNILFPRAIEMEAQ